MNLMTGIKLPIKINYVIIICFIKQKLITQMSKNENKQNSPSKEKVTFTKNSFPLQQVKKMIGKKLIVPLPNLIVTIQDKNNAKILKTKILEMFKSDKSDKNVKKKNLIITTVYNNGILHVFKHIDIYLAISSISYKEMSDGVGDNILVTVQQYPKLSKSELKKLV